MRRGSLHTLFNIIRRKKVFFIIPFCAIFLISSFYVWKKSSVQAVEVSVLIPEEAERFNDVIWRGQKLQEISLEHARGISVRRKGETENIRLEFSKEKTAQIARLANEIAKGYVKEVNKNIEYNFKEYADKRLDEIKAERKKIEESLIEADTSLDTAEKELKAFNRESAAAESRRSGLETKLGNLRAEKAALLRVFTELHPDVVAVNKEIEGAEKEIDLTEEPDLAQKKNMEREFEERSIIYQRLKEEKDALVDEEGILRRGWKDYASVSSYADVLEMNASKSKKNAIPHTLGFIAALFIGSVSLYLSAAYDTSIDSRDAIKEVLDIPILAQVPYLKPSFLTRDNSRLKSRLLFAYKDGDVAFEVFKSLYMHMQTDIFNKAEKKGTVVLITSADRSEGKSLIASNLSLILARSKKNTLLIDCNLRAPSFHASFGLNKKTEGLSDVLNRRIDVAEATKTITDLLVEGGVRWMDKFTAMGIDRLKLITAGSDVKNSSDLLGSREMDEFLRKLRENHDYIIFDSPAVNVSTDALILSQKADCAILVYKTAITPRRSLIEAKEKMLKIKAPLKGVIFNNTNKSIRVL